jgi:hypothetical protein
VVLQEVKGIEHFRSGNLAAEAFYNFVNSKLAVEQGCQPQVGRAPQQKMASFG